MQFKKGHIPWNKGIGINKICQVCDKEFYISLSKNKEGKGKYCSIKCKKNRFIKTSKEFVLNEDMAELVGIIIGDGCISKNWNRKDYRIFISGNPIEDKDYMKNYIPNLIKKCLGKKPSIYNGKNGALLVQFQNEAFRLFLEKNGIAERKTKSVSIPKKILENNKLFTKCLKGIADTDFTLIFTKRNKDRGYYPRISAQFASPNLVKDIERGLRNLEFTLNVKYNKKIKDKRGYNWITNQINLDGPNNLKKWLKLIGFSNQRILTRYLVWNKYGYLNSKSTLPERLKLIGAGGDAK